MSFGSALLDLLYPPKCALCTRLGGLSICDECSAAFSFAPPVDAVRPLERVESVFLYQGRARQAVLRLKFEGATSLIAPLAEWIAKAWEERGLDRYERIVPIPITRARRRWRGFNQAEELASGLPQDRISTDLLRRVRERPPQVGLSRAQRQQNLMEVFEVGTVAGMSILLIDDVATTQSTLRAAAEALKAGGASEVAALTLAWEP